MAISFPITGVTTTYSATRSPSFTLGTAPLENDIIVVSLSASAPGQTTTDASGWTNVLGANTETDTDSHAGIMLYHRVTSGEAGASTVSWTLTNVWDGTRSGTIIADVLRGVETSGELVAFGSTFSSMNTVTPWVIATVTPTDTCQIIALVAGDGSQTITTPGGWTLRTDATGAANTIATYSRDTLGSNGVATGTTNITPSSGDEYLSIVAGFKPAAAAATDANAGSAAVTATANNPQQAVAPAATAATVTVTANNPPPSVAQVAGLASVTVTANNPTVSTAAATNAQAGVASVTVTANNSSESAGVVAGLASVTVTANNPNQAGAPIAGSASVTVTANNAQQSAAPTAGSASVTITANTPTLSAQVNIGTATVTFTANNPTVDAQGAQEPGPYGPTDKWREPSIAFAHDPEPDEWSEPSVTVGSD